MFEFRSTTKFLPLPTPTSMEPPNPSSASNLWRFLLSSPNYPRKLHYLQSSPSLFFFLLTISVLSIPATSRIQVSPWMPSIPNPKIPYSNHCNHIVSESQPDAAAAAAISGATLRSLRFDVGFFSGGDSFFDRDQLPTSLPKSASFFPFSGRRTMADELVYKLQAKLNLRKPRSVSSSSSSDLGRRRLRRMWTRSGGLGFGFYGFWSESTGRLCMVGSSTVYSATGNLRTFDAVLKLNYSTNSSIYGNLIRGVLEIVNDNGDPSYLQSVSILGVAQNNENYEYKLVERGKWDCGVNRRESERLSLDELKGGLCSVLAQQAHLFGLKYGNGCSGNGSCSPINGSIGYVPEFMSFFPISCEEDGKMRMLLSFRNSSISGRLFPFDPSTTLVAEGSWDGKMNRFCGAACRILNFTHSLSNAVVGDCSIKLSLSVSAVLSIREMGAVNGEVWSERRENDPGYFSRIEIWSIREPLWLLPSLKYMYSKIDRVRKSCGDDKNGVNLKGKGYPNAHSSDMELYMMAKNSKGVASADYAHASPLFVGDRLYHNPLLLGQGAEQPGVALHMNKNHNTFTNISYRLSLPSDFDLGGNSRVTRGREISAEGTYDRGTGILCMVGCQSLSLNNGDLGKNNSLDCDIKINIKFVPFKYQNNNRLKGTIESIRGPSDPLYFGRIDVSSNAMSARQAKESIWRMDLEFIMVLIANTLSCVFVGLQLHHVKKHPEVLPFVSILMLIVLTLGHMIPLLLNFEALFKNNHNQQNTFFENGGWLEANEIIVRMVTMVAFLLESRLLQLSWTARKGDENRKSIWDSEKKVVYATLPLYVTGGLIAWLVNLKKPPRPMLYFNKPRSRHLLYHPFTLKRTYQRPSLWKDLKSYAGLIHDGFLLPQILFNTFHNSRETALATSFYMGITGVRLMPHIYDLYRGHSYGKLLDRSYIYANPKMDYYSTAWDIIIPSGGLMFSVLIFLQQRFSGRCILPRRVRERVGYERVSTVGSVELQVEDGQRNSK